MSFLSTIKALQVVFQVPQNSMSSIFTKLSKGYFAIETNRSQIGEVSIFKDESLEGEALIDVVVKSGVRFKSSIDVAVSEQLTK